MSFLHVCTIFIYYICLVHRLNHLNIVGKEEHRYYKLYLILYPKQLPGVSVSSDFCRLEDVMLNSSEVCKIMNCFYYVVLGDIMSK